VSLKKQNITVKRKIGEAELIRLKKMKPYIKPTIPHKHGGYNEIIFITKGEGFHTIEFDTHSVNPPIIYNLKPGQIHHWEFTEKPEGYVLMYKLEFIQEFHQLNSNEFEIDESILLDKETCSRFEQIFNEISDELEKKRGSHHQLVASYLNIILIELSRLSQESKHEKSTLDSRYQRFTALIQHHFRAKKKVNEYAELMSISPKNLNEICKKFSGKTASSLIRNQIITEAKRVLIHTDKSISELSLDLGFEDSSHFAKYFKSLIGSSPKVFRSKRFQ